MNRLAVGRSARSQQADKVDNRINWLMDLHKTDADTQTITIRGRGDLTILSCFRIKIFLELLMSFLRSEYEDEEGDDVRNRRQQRHGILP